RAEGGGVPVTPPPAERVGHQLGDEGVHIAAAPRNDELPEPAYASNARSVRERGGRVHGQPLAAGAPAANRVEVFQRETERIHADVTDGARWITAVILHLLANRERPPVRRLRLQVWYA